MLLCAEGILNFKLRTRDRVVGWGLHFAAAIVAIVVAIAADLRIVPIVCDFSCTIYCRRSLGDMRREQKCKRTHCQRGRIN